MKMNWKLQIFFLALIILGLSLIANAKEPYYKQELVKLENAESGMYWGMNDSTCILDTIKEVKAIVSTNTKKPPKEKNRGRGNEMKEKNSIKPVEITTATESPLDLMKFNNQKREDLADNYMQKANEYADRALALYPEDKDLSLSPEKEEEAEITNQEIVKREKKKGWFGLW